MVEDEHANRRDSVARIPAPPDSQLHDTGRRPADDPTMILPVLAGSHHGSAPAPSTVLGGAHAATVAAPTVPHPDPYTYGTADSYRASVPPPTVAPVSGIPVSAGRVSAAPISPAPALSTPSRANPVVVPMTARERRRANRLPTDERNMLVFVSALLALGTLAIVAMASIGR